MSERDINQQVADQVRRTFRWNGNEYLRGDCLVLLDGKVIAVEKNRLLAMKSLRDADPDPERGMIVEVTPPIIDVIRSGGHAYRPLFKP
jgi:hypothetical protein